MEDKCSDCPLGITPIDLGKALGGINQSIKGLNGTLKSVDAKLSTQNGRIRKLEHWRSVIAGIIGFLVIVVPIVLKVMNKI